MISRYPNLSNDSSFTPNISIAGDDSISVGGADSEKISFSNDLDMINNMNAVEL